MKIQKRISLLDLIADELDIMISDLKYTDNKLICNVCIKLLDEEQYDIEEWKETLHYIFRSEDFVCINKEELAKKLKEMA